MRLKDPKEKMQRLGSQGDPLPRPALDLARALVRRGGLRHMARTLLFVAGRGSRTGFYQTADVCSKP